MSPRTRHEVLVIVTGVLAAINIYAYIADGATLNLVAGLGCAIATVVNMHSIRQIRKRS